MINFDDTAREKNGKWQHLVEYCLGLYQDFKKSKYRANVISEAKESRAKYAQEEKATSDPWEGASNIVLPLLTISIDNLEPRIVSAMAGKKPYIEFEVGGQPPDEQLKIVEDWFNNELEDVISIEKRSGEVAHNLLLDGTVFPVCEYDLNESLRRYFVFQGDEKDPRIAALLEGAQLLGDIWVYPDGTPVTIDKVDTVFEGGKLDIISISDIYIPDDADDWEKTPVLRRTNPTYAELMQKRGDPGYMNIGPWLTKEQGDSTLSTDEQSPQQEYDGVLESGKKTIDCLECYISYIYRDEIQEDEDVKDFTERRLVALIALDKKVLLRLIPLVELNFKNEHLIKRVRLFPEKGKSYGTSLYGKCKAIQNGASKSFNTAINIAEVTMIPWFLFEERVGFKAKQTQLQPGKGIPVDSVEGLYFPRFNINPSQMIEFIYLWVSFWERLVSIGDLQVGRPKEGQNTATETLAVIQEGNVKHNYQAETFRDEFLATMRTLYDLYYQNMPLDKTFHYNGQQINISRQIMSRPFAFRLTGSTDLSNKLVKRKENEDFYSLSMSDPRGVFNPVEIAKDLVRSFGRTDVDKYINPQVNQIIQAINTIPGAAELFQQAVAQAQDLAKGIEAGGKAAGAIAASG